MLKPVLPLDAFPIASAARRASSPCSLLAFAASLCLPLAAQAKPSKPLHPARKLADASRRGQDKANVRAPRKLRISITSLDKLLLLLSRPPSLDLDLGCVVPPLFLVPIPPPTTPEL